MIDKNLEIAKGIGFRSTPTVIVNEQLIPGYVNYDKLMSIINVNNVGNGSDVSNNANNVEVSDKNDVSSEKIDDKSQDIVDSPVSKPEQQEETSNSTNNN